MTDLINTRIAVLRQYMKEKGLQAFIVPSTDAHMSEYIPEHWNSRTWISGFTGSAGTVVITHNKAGLWTDSRYFLQAMDELSGSEIILFKDRLPETPSIADWLLSELKEEDCIGIDGKVFSAKEVLKLTEQVSVKGLSVIPGHDPFETIWTDRPPLPQESVFIFSEKYAGESASDKIDRIRKAIKEIGTESIFVSTLDTIAWMLNIRGNDVPYNPVTVAHAYLSQDEVILFIDRKKLSDEVVDYLYSQNVTIHDYDKVSDYLSGINTSVCLDSSKIAFSIYNTIIKQNRVTDILSPVDLMKSQKNKVEIQGFRNAMVSDGIALTKFFMWLEDAVPKGIVTEYNVGQKLKEFRSEQENFVGESFETIAGYGANAAKNHYHPTAENCLKVEPKGFLLIDSGGQYLDGTTDITRTVALGEISREMKEDYTLVLKGNIGLGKAVFPKGTRGSQIDILARKPMWEYGVNYLHGTGHGVGHYLNVHEGPHSIRPEENPVTMHLGMIASNEPGIYRDHQYGVRIENLMVTCLEMKTEFGEFYSFETLTLCYIDTTSIIREMMTEEEIAWLNNYHRVVYNKLSPYLSEDEKKWLKEKTKSIF